MKPHIALLFLISALTCACESPTAPASAVWADNPELTALNQTLTDAYEREDVPLLRQLLADGHVHNNVFGMALTKEQFLGDIESGVLKFLSYETPEIRWHVDGATAIATGIIQAKAVRAGKPVPAERFLFTRIFTRENGEWKVLLFHNTMEGRPPADE